MAVQNHIYIYIGKNGAPTILNVDNAADGTALEQLGAIKMPEAMAAEIFGENIRYADNTTCTITENPDNAEFPFTVQFDSSKIPAKPKRNTAMFANLPMPSNKYIDIAFQDSVDVHYTVPANGYIFVANLSNGTGTFTAHESIYLYQNRTDCDNDTDLSKCIMSASDTLTSNWNASGIFMPVQKGQAVKAKSNFSGPTATVRRYCRFIYAQGEI